MSASLGTDLLVTPFMQAQDASSLDLTVRSRPLLSRIPGAPAEVTDLDVASDRRNLAQALILRLLTPQGSLAALGHGGYGSQLYKLIGQHKNEEQRNLCRAYVLEVVLQEPRVQDKAVEFKFELDQEAVDSFVFTLAVQPKDQSRPIGLTLEFAL